MNKVRPNDVLLGCDSSAAMLSHDRVLSEIDNEDADSRRRRYLVVISSLSRRYLVDQ